MKRFLRQLLFFLSPVLLLGAISEYLLRAIPNDYKLKKAYLDAHASQIQVLCLGNSHAYYGINPRYLSLPSYNASHISQSVNLDLKLFDKYRDRFSQLHYLLLPVSYASFTLNLENSEESWRIKNYALYYGIKPDRADLSNYSEMLANKLDINLLRLSSYYLQGKPEITSDETGFGTNYSSSIKIDLESDGITAARRHTAKDFRDLPLLRQALQELLDECGQRHVRVILFMPPAYVSYRDHLNQAQLDTVLNTVTHLVQTHDRVTFRDYLADPSFTASDFYDADHLNERGARKLTLLLDSLVRAPATP
ncbi:MAG TPA: hypothetical protein VG870_05630 [Chitinophagaceae bacterium]|nr:hypothetical protein [Chitinophagaceae bacterium]